MRGRLVSAPPCDETRGEREARRLRALAARLRDERWSTPAARRRVWQAARLLDCAADDADRNELAALDRWLGG